MIRPLTEIEYLVHVGRACEKITKLREDLKDLSLSKHNPYFKSEHEVDCDKLDVLRRRLSFIEDELSYIDNLLNTSVHEDDE